MIFEKEGLKKRDSQISWFILIIHFLRLFSQILFVILA
jgi:hypothetical protein